MLLKTDEFVVGLFALCVGFSVTVPAARADFVDYNNPGDLEANFSLNNAGAGNRYSEVASGGIGGSRAIETAGAVDAVHTTALFDQNNFSLAQSGDQVTLSQFVLRGNDAGFPFEFSFQQLGVLQGSDGRLGTDSGPDSYASLRVMSDTNANTGVFLQTEVRGSADTSRTQQNIANQTADLVAGHWYKFSATFENVSPTELLITGALEDWGVDASAFQSTILELTSSDSQSLVDLSGLNGDTVLGDSQVWAGWRGFGEGGAVLFDNFSAVPEPATLVLISLGTLALLRRRRSPRDHSIVIPSLARDLGVLMVDNPMRGETSRSQPGWRHGTWACLVLVACMPASPRVRADTFDTTGDAVLGQPDFTANAPNYPDGFPTADNLALSNAAHVAVAPDGRVYVSDTDNHRVLSWASAAGFTTGEPADMVLGQPDFFSNAANGHGLNEGSLCLPQGVCVDEAGNLWVADAFNSRVLKYDNPPANDTLADLVIGQPDFTSNDQNLGNGDHGTDVALPDGLQFPGRVLVVGTDVYVADSGNSRVLHYTNPTTNKPFADLVFGQYGDFTCRAKKNDGLCNIGCCASADNLFNPIGIALDTFGNLYIADWADHRVLRFDTPLSTDTTADAVFGQPDLESNTFDNGGPASGLQLPIDLRFDSAGDLYVADSQNHRVLVFFDPLFDQATPDRVFGQLGSFTTDTANHGLGSFATDADGLQGCTGLAIDAADNLLVVDTNNNRLLRFDEVLQPVAAADFDRDGDVDLTDFARLSACVTGPAGLTPTPLCQAADLDGNGVVELLDFAAFQRCMSGDGVPDDVNCVN